MCEIRRVRFVRSIVYYYYRCLFFIFFADGRSNSLPDVHFVYRLLRRGNRIVVRPGFGFSKYVFLRPFSNNKRRVRLRPRRRRRRRY